MPGRPFPSLFTAATALLMLGGCTTTGQGPGAVSPHRFASVAESQAAVASGPQRLRAISNQLETTESEFAAYAKQQGAAWRKRGYMTGAESDRMEHLLFRHVSAQDVLADLIGGLGDAKQQDVAAHVLVVDAQFLLIHHRARLVAEFKDDRVAVAKLNEAFYRSEIPQGSFDKFRLSTGSGDTARRLHAAWVLFEHERADDDLRKLAAKNPSYAGLIARVPDDHRRAAASVAAAGGGIAEKLEHTEAAALARRARGDLGDLRYQARCLLFKDVSRIKNPGAKVIAFSAKQHAEVKRLLQPGDIILTYTAGYMSDVFIPGSFKHGITYVGTPAERKVAGMSRAVEREDLPDGKRADVIEAVAEGVIFNDLSYLMNTHVNRMVVLRPRYGSTHRAAYLDDVASYLGDSYDFLFDFADASRQVCTEVIYRGMNGRAGIDFPLTGRGGHPTLSADDVVNYHFHTDGRHFEVILFAEEDAGGFGHKAVIRTGADAAQRLREQMAKKQRGGPAIAISVSLDISRRRWNYSPWITISSRLSLRKASLTVFERSLPMVGGRLVLLFLSAIPGARR